MGSMSYSTILVDYFAKRQGIKIIDTIFQRKKMLGRDSAVKKNIFNRSCTYSRRNKR